MLSHLKQDIKELKKIQREATEVIREKEELQYQKRIKRFSFFNVKDKNNESISLKSIRS